MAYGQVIAHRKDGLGFVIGRLISVGRRHGHRVYRVKSRLSGAVVILSAAQYSVVSV